MAAPIPLSKIVIPCEIEAKMTPAVKAFKLLFNGHFTLPAQREGRTSVRGAKWCVYRKIKNPLRARRSKSPGGRVK